MQALTLPAGQGWLWLLEGYRIFRRNPALLSMLTMGYWLTVLVLQSLPLIGPILASVAMPVLSVGMMRACRAISQGDAADPMFLYSGFRLPQKRVLYALGGLYLLCSLGALILSSVVDDGALLELMTGSKPLDDEALERGDYLPGMQFVTLIMAPAMMAWWFAPVLAAWHGFKAPKALFFSLVACWRNWRAFLVYGLAIILYAAVIPATVLGVLALLVPAIKPFLLSLMLVPLMLIFGPSLFASFYVSYRDVFVVMEDA